MSQSRIGSLVEAWANIVIGYTINYAMNLLILNGIFDLKITLSQNIVIGMLFTVVSLSRQYVIRRWFATRIHGWASKFGGA